MVMGANVQVCWEKFCRYWDVEARLAPLEGDVYHLTAEAAVGLCDENTIGVVGILGSTFDGCYEPIADMCTALDKLQADTGVDVPVHVDAASGGFIAPFLDPGLVWDFRLPRVQSINASGHKYGLVYPGVGWIVWRNPDALPQELVFDVNYLGGDMPTFGLNFSRPGNQVAAQYYNFLRLGFDGFRRVQQSCRDVARYTADAIAALGPFELLTNGSDLPVFAFTLKAAERNYTVFDVSERLRDRGWLVPAYTFPENRQDLAVLQGRRPQRHVPRPRRPPHRRSAASRHVPRPADRAAPRGRPREVPPLERAPAPRVSGPARPPRRPARAAGTAASRSTCRGGRTPCRAPA